MAENTFKVADKLRAASAAQQSGDLEGAKRGYVEVLERFPGNGKAKAALSKVETKIAAAKASGFDQNFVADPLKAASLGALSGIEDPLAIPKSAARVSPARGKQPDLLGASEGVNKKKFTLERTETPVQIFMRGLKAFENRRFGKAIRLYEEALESDPNLHAASNSLGVCLLKVGRRKRSIEVLEALIDRAPEMKEAYCNLAISYAETGMHSEAIAQYKVALEIQPDFPLALCNLGGLYGQVGRKEDAVSCFETSIKLDPCYTTAFLSISAAKRFVKGDALIETMQDVLKNNQLDGDQEYKLQFALGKAMADVGDTAKAFRHVQLANAKAKEVRNLDFERDKFKLEIIRTIFENHDVPKLLVPEIDDWPVSPIFVVGMPRCGSTLVEQVISSHSEVHGAGEIGDLNVVMSSIIRKFKDDISDNTVDKNLLVKIRNEYLNKVKVLPGDKKFLTDKNLLNFRYIGFIISAFPEAKIVHMNRDPMAVCWSNFKNNFVGDGLSFAFNLDDLGEYYNLYLDMMDFWREKFPNRIIDVNYEAFTQDQEGETRKLLKNCGLEFEDACLNFHKSDRVVKTASLMQVRQKVYQGSSKEWEKYRPYLKDLIKTLGAA